MALRFEKVDGPGFASEASRILKEAWANQTAMDYSPAYLAWQLGFPSALPAIAVAAFDGVEPVGFAAATVRRLRLNAEEKDGFITSFWAMRPGKGPFGAILLLETLLQALKDFAAPVVTFGVHDGRGERLFPQSYARSGFVHADLGLLGTRAFLSREHTLGSVWDVTSPGSSAILPSLIERCTASDPSILYVSPDPAQLHHYAKDPRSRHLLVATNRETGSQAAAWAVRAAIRSSSGLQHIATLDSVILERSRPDALPALLAAASRCWPGTGGPVVVTASSLAGFDAKALQSMGIRQTSSGFRGHLYLPPSQKSWQRATAAACEII